jgi:succinate-semialdehyde dehydrogenase/glutarate-semialdehyde dehydrogenase
MGHARHLANDSVYGLGASIWTEDPELAWSLEPELNLGSLFINEMVKSDFRIPFGGVKQSGFGRELGRAGMLEFCNVKTIWQG